MPFFLTIPKEEYRRIAVKLSADALALFVVSGALYLFSEFVLPGIFSSRVNFFLFFLAFGGLILIAALSGLPGSGAGISLSRGGRIGLASLATVFLFWGEKRLPVSVLIPSMLVMFAVLFSLFTDIFETDNRKKR